MSLWGDIFGIKKRRAEYEEAIAEDEYEDEEFQHAAFLHDILGVVEDMEHSQSEMLELMRGILEELQGIRNAIPAFHEGVEMAQVIARESADNQEAQNG